MLIKTFYSGRTVFFCIILILLFKDVSGQNFHLVKDINTESNSNPTPNELAVLNGIIYFNADDGIHGKGLWRSDGTPAGTYQLKEGIDPQYIAAGNGLIFFAANTALGLWISDGTVAGTKPVLSSLPMSLSSFWPQQITNVNGTVYFSIQGYNIQSDLAFPYSHLWKSDGTSAGTVLVQDFGATMHFGQRRLSELTPVFNKLYFSLDSRLYESGGLSRLWVTDGTPTGTYKISDGPTDPKNIVAPYTTGPDSALVYFLSPESSYSPVSLWATDGQRGNAQKISNTGISSIRNYSKMIAKDGIVYFVGQASDYTDGKSLYRYDKNSGLGIQPVALFTNHDPVTGTYAGVEEVGSGSERLFFTVYNVLLKRYQLWTTGTQSTSAQLLKDNLRATNFTDVEGTLYFTGQDSVGGKELWKSDGTSAGTVLVKDIVPGKRSSVPLFLTAFGNDLLFSATADSTGRELWISNSNPDSTMLVKDIKTTRTDSARIGYLTPLKDKVVFIANSGYGRSNFDLWSSDGTSTKTEIIKDTTVPNLQPNAWEPMTVAGNNAYFFYKENDKTILFKTDGESAGTIAIDTFNSVTENLSDFGHTDSLFYFLVGRTTDNQWTTEIWRTDGTKANTFSIGSHIDYQWGISYVGKNGNSLYFKVTHPSEPQLWVTDGTQAGTTKIGEFSGISAGISYKKKFLFEGAESLVATKGTSTDTQRLDSSLSNIDNFAISNGILFFSANDLGAFGDVGYELFKTDGTTGGTVLVKDISADKVSSSPYNFTDLNGVLYFFAFQYSNSSSQYGLWKSDGTSAGTQLVKAFGLNSPGDMVVVNGRVYFLLNDAVLWESDGTDVGTHRINDTGLTGVRAFNYDDDNRLVVAGNKLFFTGSSDAYANELWVGELGRTLPVTLTNFSATLRGRDGVVQWTVTSNSINKAFVLERSPDGIYFSPIAEMPGATGFSKNDYTYTDKNLDDLHVQKVYYRLRLIDIDGSVSYSKIVVLNLQKTDIQITVAPNPVKENLLISSSVAISGATIKIIDLTGKVLITMRQNIAANSTVSINVSSLIRGGYVVTVEGAGINYNCKIIKD